MRTTKPRVGVIVPRDESGTVTAAALTEAQRKAAEHLGGEVELIEREGLAFSGLTTHITFQLVKP